MYISQASLSVVLWYELLALNINVPLYFNFRVRHNIQRLAHDQSSVQEHLEKQVLGIYTNAKFSAEATVLQWASD